MNKKTCNDINGLIILDKPKNFTSNDCLSIIKKVLHPMKIGHTGTLDPNASGVLVCLLGKATKCQDYLMSYGNKVYEAELVIGISTDTEDITGDIVEGLECIEKTINIEDALKSFIGEYNQIPPMYSAKKVNGQKLVDMARKGKVIDREACNLRIEDIRLKNKDSIVRKFTDDVYKEKFKNYDYAIIDIVVTCSKGTYIRTLCKDIGERIGIPSCMGNLRRISTGYFDIDSSITLETLKEKVNVGDLSFIKPCYYQAEDSVVTFGKFETLHIGHQMIIKEAVRIARERGLKSTVLIVGKNDDNAILSEAQRTSKLKYFGVDNVLEFPLNEITKDMSPDDFVNDILLKQLKAKVVVVGSDASFGKMGKGDSKLLNDIAKKIGTEVIVFDKLKVENTNTDISSTLIFDEYKKENISLVNKLLDRKLL